MSCTVGGCRLRWQFEGRATRLAVGRSFRRFHASRALAALLVGEQSGTVVIGCRWAALVTALVPAGAKLVARASNHLRLAATTTHWGTEWQYCDHARGKPWPHSNSRRPYSRLLFHSQGPNGRFYICVLEYSSTDRLDQATDYTYRSRQHTRSFVQVSSLFTFTGDFICEHPFSHLYHLIPPNTNLVFSSL